MTTILSAGGPIANGLAEIMAAQKQPFRLVARKPKPVYGGETVAADLADRDQAIRAVAGSGVVHLLVGLPYRSRGLARALAAYHGQHHRGLEARRGEAAVLR